MKVLDYILDLLYPPRCPFCRGLTNGGRLICRECRRALPVVPRAAQEKRVDGLARCYSALFYDGSVRASILRYKFGGAAAYCRAYGEILADCIDENDISCDIITWASISRQRMRRRGYDQAQLMAQELSRLTGIPCARLLKKTRNNPAQSGTNSRAARYRNVKGVYAPAPGAAIDGRRVLVIDDVVTTGATLSECAAVLKAAGAAEISALTLARKMG